MAVPHSEEYISKKRKALRIKAAIISGVILIVLAGTITLFNLNRFKIRSYEANGNHVTPTTAIESIASRDLSGRYLFVFPKSNIILAPRNRIKRDLMSEIPRLASVGLQVSSAGKLNVSVTERTPFALYCADISDLTLPSGCYFIDKTGFIFSEAPSFSGDVYFIYTQTPSPEAQLGIVYMPADRFKSLSDFASELNEIGVHARAFNMTGDEYDLILPNGGKIIWNKEDNLEDVAADLKLFLQSPKISKDPNFLDKIDHIDLRLVKNSRIYWVLR